MRLDIQVDSKKVSEGLRGIESSMRAEFAKGLERMANDVQSDVRSVMGRNFTIAESRRTFMRNMVKRTKEDRATALKLEAAVRIEGPQTAKDRATLLTRHEEGGAQHARGNLFFLPSKELRPTNTSLPARSMYPKALRLMDQRGIGGATDSVLSGGLKGKRRKIAGVAAKLGVLRKVGLGGTFLIQRPDGSAAIFQRQGEGREGLSLLWSLIPRIKLPARLRFFETAQRSVDRTLVKHMETAITNAFRKL